MLKVGTIKIQILMKSDFSLDLTSFLTNIGGLSPLLGEGEPNIGGLGPSQRDIGTYPKLRPCWRPNSPAELRFSMSKSVQTHWACMYLSMYQIMYVHAYLLLVSGQVLYSVFTLVLT